jgi:hypothetical protein
MELLAKLQLPAAMLLVVAVAIIEAAALPVPAEVVPILLVLAAALGVPRPSEKAKALIDG